MSFDQRAPRKDDPMPILPTFKTMDVDLGGADLRGAKGTIIGYAIIDAKGTIISLHSEPVPPGEGWGFDRELLVELTRPHVI